jgi:hypothetical protein
MAQPLPSSVSPAISDSAHAAAHLASLRQALRAADMIAGKTTDQLAQPVAFSEAWIDLPPATQRCFEARASRAARSAGRGLEVIATRPVNPAAAELLSERLRADLARIEQLFVGR